MKKLMSLFWLCFVGVALAGNVLAVELLRDTHFEQGFVFTLPDYDEAYEKSGKWVTNSGLATGIAPAETPLDDTWELRLGTNRTGNTKAVPPWNFGGWFWITTPYSAANDAPNLGDQGCPDLVGGKCIWSARQLDGQELVRITTGRNVNSADPDLVLYSTSKLQYESWSKPSMEYWGYCTQTPGYSTDADSNVDGVPDWYGVQTSPVCSASGVDTVTNIDGKYFQRQGVILKPIVANNTTYQLVVGTLLPDGDPDWSSSPITYASDANATQKEIVDGFVDAINGDTAVSVWMVASNVNDRLRVVSYKTGNVANTKDIFLTVSPAFGSVIPMDRIKHQVSSNQWIDNPGDNDEACYLYTEYPFTCRRTWGSGGQDWPHLSFTQNIAGNNKLVDMQSLVFSGAIQYERLGRLNKSECALNDSDCFDVCGDYNNDPEVASPTKAGQSGQYWDSVNKRWLNCYWPQIRSNGFDMGFMIRDVKRGGLLWVGFINSSDTVTSVNNTGYPITGGCSLTEAAASTNNFGYPDGWDCSIENDLLSSYYMQLPNYLFLHGNQAYTQSNSHAENQRLLYALNPLPADNQHTSPQLYFKADVLSWLLKVLQQAHVNSPGAFSDPDSPAGLSNYIIESFGASFERAGPIAETISLKDLSLQATYSEPAKTKTQLIKTKAKAIVNSVMQP